jgi:hypothetical protein
MGDISLVDLLLFVGLISFATATIASSCVDVAKDARARRRRAQLRVIDGAVPMSVLELRARTATRRARDRRTSSRGERGRASWPRRPVGQEWDGGTGPSPAA